MAKPSSGRRMSPPGFAIIEIWTMAKLTPVENAVRVSLLSSKSELWQSLRSLHQRLFESLLSSKSELWQSSVAAMTTGKRVCYHRNLNYGKAWLYWFKNRKWVCYHRNLNYGKAHWIYRSFMSVVCYHRNLNYGKARLPQLQSNELVCYHRNLNYGKANTIATAVTG